MKIIYGVEHIKQKFKNPVMAIGVFDGLHRGHQQLIQQAIREAKKIKGTALVMTFWPHPAHVLRPEIRLPLLVSLPHRLKLLEGMGVDVCVVIPFTKSFSRLSPEEFVKNYLAKNIKPIEIFVGYDFRFGKDRLGDLNLFKAIGKTFGFKVNVLHAIKGGSNAISSTRIRELVAQGEFTQASRLLGRSVSTMGIVCRGDARGKTLGFPTANIDPDGELIPPRGVYAVSVLINKKKYGGMVNIGRRPSFKSDNKISIEVHIFHFRKEIYNKTVIIEFIKKIRDEKFFFSTERLIRQLCHDEMKAKEILSKNISPR